MNSSSSSPAEFTRSIWQQTAGFLERPRLGEDLTADVCVVGAGMAGLSVAYELTREGRRVVVLDRNAIGAGMTGRTTAHVTAVQDDRFQEIERLHGSEGAQTAAKSHTAAIARIAQIVAEEEIRCDFERVDGWLFNPPGESRLVLEDEIKAIQGAGLTVERHRRAPLADFDTGPALRFPDQAQFHPIAYLTGVAQAIERHGGRIFTGSAVSSVQGGKAAHVKTQSGCTVRAEHIVVATNVPVNDRFVIHTKQAPYTTYAMAFHLPPGAVEKALFWDTGERAGLQDEHGPVPYHYVRTHRLQDHEVLIVGGADHKTGQASDGADRFAALERWTRERVPEIGKMEARWSGQVMEPVDAMAFIGRNPADEDNVYVVTGDSGNGITHGAVAGLLLPDLIAGRKNPWADLYDPGRVTLAATAEFAHENLNVAAQFTDYATPGDVRGTKDIERGQGAILRSGVSKLAVYRDDSGLLHRLSAVCPHLKCIVHWNAVEHTWDCPCHGSRFDACGAVLTGPATSGLEKVEADDDA